MQTPHYKAGPVVLHHGDCKSVMAAMPDASVDAIVTDPPYELGFMGKSWDASGIAYDVEVWRQALRVLKPGGHLLAFGGSRTYHRMAVAIEDAGFELRDSIAWLYGCLSDDTEILTSEGWVRYDRATEGQHALAFDTATGALAWQAIQHVHRYPYAGEMVRLHSEHTDQLLTPNHRVVLDEGRSTPHTPYVPSDQDLCRLLTGVPGARPLPVGAEADVLAGVRGSADLAAEEGQGQAPLGAGRPYGAVRDVRDGDVEAGRLAQEDLGGVLLEPMQRRAPGGGVGEALPQGQGGLDRRQPGVLPGEDNRAEQPRMEGRRYRVQEARELCRSAVRASAGMGATDGPQGRIHHGAPATDGRPLRVPADQTGSHQPREPQPQGQPTGEPDPLAVEPGAQALRVGEDGGGRFLSSTGVTADVVDYAGVVWCITVPHGAFIARRNGLIFATGNSGFPKSLDVSKAIDKVERGGLVREKLVHFAEARGVNGRWLEEHGVASAASFTDWTSGGHVPSDRNWELVKVALEVTPEEEAAFEREVTGQHLAPPPGANMRAGIGGGKGGIVDGNRRDVAATTEAEQWQGWGTALKPSHEPVVCARKPFSVVPSGGEIDRLHHLLGGLLWLSLSPAKRAELTSPSSQAEQPADTCVSALVSAALDTSPDASDQTATFNSPALASTASSIASSWSATLGALSARTRTSTTSTASSTTTALRTLNSLLGPITSQTTMPKCGCLLGGPSSPAPSVASSSSDEWARWLHTLSASVPATATEGIALAVASALAQVAADLSDAQVAASSAAPTATTEAAASRSAYEPIVVARKPLAGTVAANVLAFGTGALNIDATRTGDESTQRKRTANDLGIMNDDGWTPTPGVNGSEAGRWPTNVVLDESQAAVLDAQAPKTGGSGKASGPSLREQTGASVAFGARRGLVGEPAFYGGELGGASRFFPTFKYEAKAPTSERPVVDGVAHATVKPLTLMRWLIRLVTPPGGVVLDPFAGSGTTLEAAVLEGFDSIGIELEEAHLPLIKSRFKKPFDQYLDLGDIA